MLNRFKYIVLTILLIVAMQATGQKYVIDSLCVNSIRHYRIEGEVGSTYLWILKDTLGVNFALINPTGTPFTGIDPVSGLTVQGSENTIKWDIPGVFVLEAIQTSFNGCDTTQMGHVKVFEQPLAFAGNPAYMCGNSTTSLSEATASHYSNLLWTSSGDGTFDDFKILNPVYKPGPNDYLAGTVTLTLTAEGLGKSGTCIPAIHSMKLTLSPLPVLVIKDPAPVCYPSTVNLTDPVIYAGTDPGLFYEYLTDTLTNTSISGSSAVAVSGKYFVKATNLTTKCYRIKPVVVTILPQPVLVIHDPAPVCEPMTINLKDLAITAGSQTPLNFEYYEDLLATVPLMNFIAVPVSGIYYIKAINPVTGCSIVKAVNVTINFQPNLVITNPPEVCFPSPVDLTSAAVIVGSNIPVSTVLSYWINAAAIIAVPDEHAIAASGTYYIKAEAPGGCFDIKPVKVVINPLPKLVIHDPAQVCEPVTVNLTLPAVTFGSDLAKLEYYKDATAKLILPDPSKVDSTGTYYIKAINPITSCSDVRPVQVVINKRKNPIFPVVNDLCINSIAPILPIVSTNGVPGTWNPVSISTATVGVSSYTFTPLAGECAKDTTINVKVTKKANPEFNPIGPICQNSSVTLPPWSNNGYTGKWNPATIMTATPGKYFFKFTPDAGLCAKDTTIEIIIAPEVVVTFDPIGPLCANSSPPILPPTDKNGLPGTWSPATISTTTYGVTDYNFYPDNGFCVNNPSMKILVTNPILLAETHKDLGYSIDPKGSINLTASGGYGKLSFLWNNGKKTQNIDSLAAGKYTVVVKDENMCSDSLTVQITRIELMYIAAIQHDACPGSDGSIDFTFTNIPDGIHDILYSGGSFKNVAIVGGHATVSAPVGSYNNIRMIVNGYTTVSFVNITIKILPSMTLNATPVRGNCTNFMGGILFNFKNVPNGVYDIEYDGGKFTNVQVISNSAMANAIAKTYNNLILKWNTCSTNSTTVTLNPPIGLYPISVTTDPSCLFPTGKIEVTYPTGPNYEYSIDGGANYQASETFDGLNSGDYLVKTREKTTLCESEIVLKTVFSIPGLPDLATFNVSEPSCEVPTGSITITNVGFGTGYDYSIDGVKYQDSKTFDLLPPNSVYLIRVRLKSTMCQSLTPVSIDPLPPPLTSPLAVITKQPDCDDQTGAIKITDSRVNGYLYNLDGGSYDTITVFSGLIPGEHLVRIKTKISTCESNPLALTINAVPTPPAPPDLVGTNPYEVCATSPIQILNANDVILIEPGTTIKWYDKPFGGTEVEPKLDKVGSVKYYCESTRGNCKSLTLTEVILTIFPVPAIPISTGDLIECEMFPIIPLDANSAIVSVAGTTIRWYDAPVSGKLVLSPTLNSVNSKIFYAEAYNGNCKSPGRTPVSLTINPTPAPPVWISNGEIIACEITPIQTLDANNGIVIPAVGTTIRWYASAAGGTPIASPILNSVGTVTWYAEASIGACVSTTRTPVKLTIWSKPADPVAKDSIACEESPVQKIYAQSCISGIPAGISVNWYDASGNPVIGNNPFLDKPDSITYFAEASNGTCVSTNKVPVTLTIKAMPVAPKTINDTLSVCENVVPVTLDARNALSLPGINLRWFKSPTGGLPVSPTLSTVNTVTYYAEDYNGVCSSAPRTPVTLRIVPLPASPVATVTVPPSCTNEHGTIKIISPIGPEFEYSIDGGSYQASIVFSDLISKTYTLRARNIEMLCESVSGAVVLPPAPLAPVMKTATVADCKCFGEDGSINFEFANVPDGTYVIVYVGIDNMPGKFQNVQVKNNQAVVYAKAGKYDILAIEANGCTSTDPHSVEITQPGLLFASTAITEIDLKSGQKGEIDLTPYGGTGPGTYQFNWRPNAASLFAGAKTEDIKNLNDGIYVVTVTDANGCQKTYIDTIPAANLPPIATDGEYNTICGEVIGNVVTDDTGYGVDSDPEGDTPSNATHIGGGPFHGSLTLNPDGTFVYKAIQGYSGDDTFSYVIFDSKNNPSKPATITILVVLDFDHDGIPDELDADADGDGILNVDEVLPGQDWHTQDSDGDGHPNYLDIDSDNDGIVDNIEAQNGKGVNNVEDPGKPEYIKPSGKVNKDGVDLAYDPANGGTRLIPVDTDAILANPDGIPDFLDSDSDNDHVPDYIEGHDLNADGKPDHVLTGKDSDGDGLDDGFETVPNICSATDNAIGSNAELQDFDRDGLRDWRDENDDNDEYLTQFEDLNMDGDYSNDDTDFDGHPEYLDYGRDCDLFIPDAFSPNDDNIHDYFQIYCIDHFPNARMYIFDQLGNKLYEKNNYGNLNVWGAPENAWWDGRTTNRSASVINGKVTPGTYFYVLQLGNGEVKKSFVFVSY
ncbi:MAG: gliding motility-associated C-terminal domain-containing protein [Bacteroidia bacterium]